MADERSKLVIAKALAYAIDAIEHLPPRWREVSDAADMRRILDGIGPPFSLIATKSMEHHINGAMEDLAQGELAKMLKDEGKHALPDGTK